MYSICNCYVLAVVVCVVVVIVVVSLRHKCGHHEAESSWGEHESGSIIAAMRINQGGECV